MASRWLPLCDALRNVQLSHGVALELLSEHLRRGEINAVAGLIREHTLAPFAEPRVGPDDPDELLYIGELDRFLRTQNDLASLPIGKHHLSLRGDRYTVVRDDTQAVVYYAARLLAESTRTELSPTFWQGAIIDPDQSCAVSDDLTTQIRTETFQVALDRKDINRLFPPASLEIHRDKSQVRKGKYDWLAAKVEAERFLKLRGIPDKQSVLERHISEWFSNQERYPNESHVRKHIAPVYRKAQERKRS